MRDLRIICLSCGGELPDTLRRTASLRCHDCRASRAPLRMELARWDQEFRLLCGRLENLRAFSTEAPSAA